MAQLYANCAQAGVCKARSEIYAYYIYIYIYQNGADALVK
jgi:hypothetical protein